ncbi:MAG: hypothetical protein VYB22_04305, partial [Pseudomonadota bacterium]|nr:hypothetical protein [Pseudomonadota bacterium]
YLLKPKNQKMTKHKLLYLAASLQKSIRMKFSWEDKAVWSKVQHETIMLPVKSDGSPDYDCMSLVIAAVQKQVINEVASKADRVIDATSNIVQSK